MSRSRPSAGRFEGSSSWSGASCYGAPPTASSFTLAGEALLDRSRQLLRDVDEAVAAALAVGGELLGRIARALEPMRGMLASDPDLVQTRATFESMNAQFSPPAGTITRPVTAGGVPSLVISPGDGYQPTVLYIHGGGYVIGSAFGYQPHAGALAASAQTAILVPDYRLAPEHPFPAALEDVQHAYLWLREQAPDPDASSSLAIPRAAGSCFRCSWRSSATISRSRQQR